MSLRGTRDAAFYSLHTGLGDWNSAKMCDFHLTSHIYGKRLRFPKENDAGLAPKIWLSLTNSPHIACSVAHWAVSGPREVDSVVSVFILSQKKTEIQPRYVSDEGYQSWSRAAPWTAPWYLPGETDDEWQPQNWIKAFCVSIKHCVSIFFAFHQICTYEAILAKIISYKHLCKHIYSSRSS